MTDPNVRLQNLRDFTVQIRRLSDDAIVGTGIAVSMDGKVVTCTHVVEKAGVDPQELEGGEVGVYFPQVRGGEEKRRRARVAACLPQNGDDMALLQLMDGPTPLGPEQVAVLGPAEVSEGNPFRSFGYCPLGPFPSSRAEGAILGVVDPPAGRSVQTDPVQLKSGEIAQGMSGAAVLDTVRNLVVGLISETWFPDASTKHRDTAWAIDARILALDPFNLAVRDTSLPKRAALLPWANLEEARASTTPGERIAWNNAPPTLEEWVGREDMLRVLCADWTDTNHLVTSLIGFGGEGKSSLARRWVEELMADPSLPQPDGVFWWGFYTRPSVDEFLEAALNYLGGGSIDPRKYPAATAKAHLIAAMLHSGRHLFVLDGLEILQYQGGDQYGLVKYTALREFLTFFAAPGHQSFCLITSRAPLLDLMEYTTYIHRDVTRLSPTDGRALLHKIGLRGSDADLDQVVADWDGHALTLSLLASLLAERYGGDISRIDLIPSPTTDEPRYDRVHRVLRRYDEYLSEAERAFLMIFSAFRTPVGEATFAPVFRADTGLDSINAPIAELSDAGFERAIEGVIRYRILSHDQSAGSLVAHPLVHSYYSGRLSAQEDGLVRAVHERIKDYYLSEVTDLPGLPTLEDLVPATEAVHHACMAGQYDEGYEIYRLHLDRSGLPVNLPLTLGDYEGGWRLLLDFFPDGDTSRNPLVTQLAHKSMVLYEMGHCAAHPGHSASFYRRSLEINYALEDWLGVGWNYQCLTEDYRYLGDFKAMQESISTAWDLACRAESKEDQQSVLEDLAWSAYLHGDLEAAAEAFDQATAMLRQIEPDKEFLCGAPALWHAICLQRMGDWDRAWRIATSNLRFCELQDPRSLSDGHHCIADLHADIGQHDKARVHYDQAVRLARWISTHVFLIEALMARGRWYAKHQSNAKAAFTDLDEALALAVENGYRLHKVDIRIARGWAYWAAGDKGMARAEAERARQMSKQMGYHWGQVDAEEVLEALDAAGNGDTTND